MSIGLNSTQLTVQQSYRYWQQTIICRQFLTSFYELLMWYCRLLRFRIYITLYIKHLTIFFFRYHSTYVMIPGLVRREFQRKLLWRKNGPSLRNKQKTFNSRWASGVFNWIWFVAFCIYSSQKIAADLRSIESFARASELRITL